MEQCLSQNVSLVDDSASIASGKNVADKDTTELEYVSNR